MSIEMISLKSPREIEAMRKAGRLTAQARALAGSMVRPGVTTKEIDTAVRRFIESHGAKPSFLGYGGYPGSACISVNDEIIHGIPGPRKLKEGDIEIDITTFRQEKGYADHRHPGEVLFVRDPETDSWRRDFTVNALYIDGNGGGAKAAASPHPSSTAAHTPNLSAFVPFQ